MHPYSLDAHVLCELVENNTEFHFVLPFISRAHFRFVEASLIARDSFISSPHLRSLSAAPRCRFFLGAMADWECWIDRVAVKWDTKQMFPKYYQLLLEFGIYIFTSWMVVSLKVPYRVLSNSSYVRNVSFASCCTSKYWKESKYALMLIFCMHRHFFVLFILYKKAPIHC